MITIGLTRLSVPFLVLLLAPALMLSCPDRSAKQSDDKPTSTKVQLNKDFSLHVGQQVALEGESLKIKFASVANDSRCPREVTCVWAGNAEVLIQAEQSGKTTNLMLNTNGGEKFPREAQLDRYKVTLVSLNPQPSRDKGIKATDYEATLLIRKD